MAFEGFPGRALAFLTGLAENNERAWFEEHRDEYEQGLLESARDLVGDLGDLLARYRDAVADPERGSALVQAVERVEEAGHAIGNPPQAHTPELPAVCAARFAELAPLQDWVVDLQAS